MTQPPYGQDPQNPQQPPNPYGQAPPPAYGQPGPYGPPPPKKSSTALIIGVVVLVVLLIAGGALAALLLLSDSDNDSDSDKAEDKTSASSEPSEPAGTIDGNGYTYTLPEDWQDVTAEAAGSPGAVDTVSAWGSKLEGGRANLIVESGPTGGVDDLDVLREQWVKNMSSGIGATPEAIPGTTIDGEEAIGTQIERTNENDVEIIQTAYLVVHDGNAYSIALSGKIGDDDAEQAFEEILASWTWD